jgi:hypothetical protein
MRRTPLCVLCIAQLLSPAITAVGAEEARLPVPGQPQQVDAEKIIRELFAADFAKHAPADRAALAKKLLAKVGNIKDDPAGSFVLLHDARELAVVGRDYETALTAADRTAEAFAIDGPSLKSEILLHADPASLTAAQRAALLPEEEKVAEQLLATGDAVAAERVAAQSQALARATRDPALIASAVTWYAQFQPAADVVSRGQAAVTKLKASPGDPALNTAAGRYDCMVKGDWAAGLPLLAKGSDPMLAEPAKAELSASAAQDAPAIASAADGWMTIADSCPSFFKAAITSHAVELYKAALPKLTGLMKLAVQKRLAKLDKAVPSSHVIDLLALINPERDALGDGGWTIEKGVLVSGSGSSTRIQVPYRPPEEYDVTIEFTRLVGDDAILFLLSRKDTAFACNVGRSDKGQCWIGRIDNNWGFRHDAGGSIGELLNGTRHQAVVKVRDDGVSVFVDGKPICSWKTDYSDLSPPPAYHLNDPTLVGFGAYRTSVAFHSVSITEIRGKGKVMTTKGSK